MIIVSQKVRYRRQASLCYEIAATLSGERVAAMAHLGDVYSGLAAAPDDRWSAMSVAAANEDVPECVHCRRTMERTGSLPSNGHLPARETFRCDGCGETLVCKKIESEENAPAALEPSAAERVFRERPLAVRGTLRRARA